MTVLFLFLFLETSQRDFQKNMYEFPEGLRSMVLPGLIQVTKIFEEVENRLYGNLGRSSGLTSKSK